MVNAGDCQVGMLSSDGTGCAGVTERRNENRVALRVSAPLYPGTRSSLRENLMFSRRRRVTRRAWNAPAQPRDSVANAPRATANLFQCLSCDFLRIPVPAYKQITCSLTFGGKGINLLLTTAALLFSGFSRWRAKQSGENGRPAAGASQRSVAGVKAPQL